MTDHDDQISNNRRRLFKALSAAPVVMTLRPGEAFATASAYQCIIDVKTPNPLYYPTTSVPACDGIDCFVYQPRYFWDVSGCNYVGQPSIIVETRTGVYITGSGEIIASMDFHPTQLTRLQAFTTSGGTTYTCSGQVLRQEGLFLAVGEAEPDLVTPTSFDYKGVYPEYRVIGTGQQGITGTCLTSIPNDLVGEFTLAKG